MLKEAIKESWGRDKYLIMWTVIAIPVLSVIFIAVFSLLSFSPFDVLAWFSGCTN